jgi:response regulator RpfG family c-di-GMP phosphodiesterase
VSCAFSAPINLEQDITCTLFFLKYPNTMTKALNILLIEDDEIEVMKFNRVLSKLTAHKIVEANNGEEAITILRKRNCS